MRRLVLFLVVFVIACSGKDEPVFGVSNEDVQDSVLSSKDGEEDVAIDAFSKEDSFNQEDTKKTSIISCGGNGFCQSDFVCVNGTICCHKSTPQECGGQCYPEDCKCVAEDSFVLCLSDGQKYCGKGVSCNKETEECVDDDGQFFCMPKAQTFCKGQNRWCKPNEVCTENSCCLKELSQECGSTCCYPEPEQFCVKEKSVCLPKGATLCDDQKCFAGTICSNDGLSICYPETGDYCGKGAFCPPGTVCAEDATCCPEIKTQKCGTECCHKTDQCVKTDVGKKCIPPNTKVCGDTWCTADSYCADKNNSLCLNVLDKLCPNGHICKDGTYCSGTTCCSSFDTNQKCGSLCCPNTWKCINSGEACIPKNATYLGNGKFCNSGTFFNKENGNCDPVGYEPCGVGVACSINQTCSEDKVLNKKKCCPSDQSVLCGDKCCYSGFECVHDGLISICMPPGAEYCKGQNVNEWCPVTTYCSKSGKSCVPIGSTECKNGGFCPISQVCTEQTPKCCPAVADVPCFIKCCPNGWLCAKVNGKDDCVSPNDQLCKNEYWPDTVCGGGAFCASDGFCINKDYKSKIFDYCGGGRICSDDKKCGGLCSQVCCETKPKQSCNLNSCFTQALGVQPKDIMCTEKDNSTMCCAPKNLVGFLNAEKSVVEKCAKSDCKKVDCSTVGNDICCTYNKPFTKGCLTGCVAEGEVCMDIPTTNSSKAYLSPTEIGMYTKNTPYEIGNYCYDGYVAAGLSGIFGIAEVSIGFSPAGLSSNYDPVTGIYHAEKEPENWIFGKSGEEVLFVESAWIIDPLEGKDCPHGPYAQLYLLLHKNQSVPEDLKKVVWASLKESDVNVNQKRFLKGPLQGGNTWTFCVCVFEFLGICAYEYCRSSFGDFDTKVKQEWISNISMRYTSGKAGIYKWDNDEVSVYLSLRESDGEPKFGRYDDYMGLQKISKAQTKKPCGQWVPLYKYQNVKEDQDPSNDSDVDPKTSKPYYYKTNQIAAFLLLRTLTIQ